MIFFFAICADGLILLMLLWVFAWLLSRMIVMKMHRADHPIIYTSLISAPVTAIFATALFAVAGKTGASQLASVFDGQGEQPDLHWMLGLGSFELWLPVIVASAREGYREVKGQRR